MSVELMLGLPPCAPTISRNFSRALPDMRISLAVASPLFIPPISRIIPAIPADFSMTLLGCMSPSRMRIASLASRAGPMARPTGWSP